MPRFNASNAIDAMEIQQILMDWSHDLDVSGGMGVAKLVTADCAYHVGGTIFSGPEAVTGFYAARNERVAKLQKDGIRTQRHALCNSRIIFKAEDHAELTFLVVNFSGEGPPPLLDATNPTIIADSRMEFRKGGDGEWRISLFDSAPIFIGNDPFLNASVVKK